MKELVDLQPHEVSLVRRAANKRRFLALKSEGGNNMNEVMEAMIQEEAENESDVLAILKTASVEGEEAESVLAAYRLFNGNREVVTPELFASLTDAMGFAVEKKDDPSDDDDKLADEPILKADGSVDLDRVSEEMRPVVEAMFKAQTELREENASLKTRVEKHEEEKRRDEFIGKADELPYVPAPEGDMSLADVMHGIASKAPEEYAALEGVLVASNEMIEKSGLFKSHGRPVLGGKTGAEAELDAKARERVAKSTDPISLAKARTLVMAEDSDLEARYLEEQRNG
jgi:hypothetical protein